MRHVRITPYNTESHASKYYIQIQLNTGSSALYIGVMIYGHGRCVVLCNSSFSTSYLGSFLIIQCLILVRSQNSGLYTLRNPSNLTNLGRSKRLA